MSQPSDIPKGTGAKARLLIAMGVIKWSAYFGAWELGDFALEDCRTHGWLMYWTNLAGDPYTTEAEGLDALADL